MMFKRRPGQRGYTLIEVMVAISLLTVASSGIIALQKVTVVGNQQAKNLAVASQIGRTWVERLRTDSVVWNYPSPSYPGVAADLNQTVWLQQVITAPNAWFRPAFVAGRGGAGFDVLGNNVTEAAITDAAFCTHLRLVWLYPGTLLRADVRVFWLREGGPGPINNQFFCGVNVTPNVFSPAFASATSPVARFHTSYFSSSIAQNTAP